MANYNSAYTGAQIDAAVGAVGDKVDKVAGKQLSTNDYTTTEKDKLAGIAAGANNYTHPTTHSIAEISGLQSELDAKVDDGQVLTNVPAGAKFTDTITTINGKTGAIAKSDITALGVPAQDTVYSHPASHAANMITESSTKRFVTDTEKANWNGKAITTTYTATIADNWNTGMAGYFETIGVSGISAADNPIVDVVLGSDSAANALYLEAWSLVYRITTAANSITLYANDMPSVAFTIQLKAVR